MNRRAAVALALVAAAVGVSSANAAPVQNIEVTAKLAHLNRVAFSPKGRAGDAESEQWIVRDRHGNAIGDLLTNCRWVTAGLRLCVAQMSLPLGAIALVGASRTRFLGQLAVVGGTGRYIGADGTMLFKATGTGVYVLSVNYLLEEQ